MKSLKNIINYLLPTFIGSILPFITLPIFTRNLTATDYGAIAMAQIYGSFLFSLNTLGLAVGYERNFFDAKKNGTSSELLYSVQLFVLISFLICITVTWVFKEYLSIIFIGSKEYSQLLFWSYIAIGISGLKTFFLLYFKNNQNSKSYMWYSIDENILNISLALYFVAYLKIGIFGIVIGQLISASFVLILLVIKFLKILPFRYDFQVFKNALSIGIPLTPKVFSGVINKSIDKYLLGKISSLGGTGILTIAYKAANIVFSFMTALENVFLPNVYKIMFDEDEKSASFLIGKYLTPYIYLSTGFCLLVATFIHEFFYLFTTPSFHQGGTISIILIMLYGTYFFGKIPQLTYKKKTYIITILSFVSLIITIFISIPLVKFYGIFGAALATFISGVTSGALFFYISQKYYIIYWETKKILIIFSIFWFSSIGIIILDFLMFKYFYILLFKLFFICIYFFYGFKINVFQKISLQNIRLSLFNKI